MLDYTYREVRAFRVEAARGYDIAWFDTSRFEIASIQLGSAKAVTCVLELVYCNSQEYPMLFSVTKEIGATNPDFESVIDVSGSRWLGARIKTAGATDETVDLFFYATCSSGTGTGLSQNTIEGR